MATLYLIHGFIGSGKTTFAKKLAEEKNAVRFTADEWMIHFYGVNPPADRFAEYHTNNEAMIWRMAEEFLSCGRDVILDYGFWSRESRDEYRALAKGRGVDCLLYTLASDFDVCKERVLKRTDDMPDGALFIDANALNLFWAKFEPVTDDEQAIAI